MMKIYERGDRDDPTWWCVSVGVLHVGLGIWIIVASFLSLAMMIGFGIAALGIVAIAHEARLYRQSPLEVGILDGGRLQVTARHGTYTYIPEQLWAITCIFDASVERLFLRASGSIWYMLCSKDEAESVMATLVTLNPSIRVKREENCGGG